MSRCVCVLLEMLQPIAVVLFCTAAANCLPLLSINCSLLLLLSCLFCTTTVTQHTRPQPILLVTQAGTVQSLRHPILYLDSSCRASCETLQQIMAFTMMSTERGRSYFGRLFVWPFLMGICCFPLAPRSGIVSPARIHDA